MMARGRVRAYRRIAGVLSNMVLVLLTRALVVPATAILAMSIVREREVFSEVTPNLDTVGVECCTKLGGGRENGNAVTKGWE